MKKVKMTLQEEILAIRRMNKKLLNENYEESYEIDELSNIEMGKFGEDMPMDEMDEMGEYGDEIPMDEMGEYGEGMSSDYMTDEMSMYEDDEFSEDGPLG